MTGVDGRTRRGTGRRDSASGDGAGGSDGLMPHARRLIPYPGGVLNGERQGEVAENRCCYRNVDLGGLVRTDLDDLVTALYVTVDDLLGPRLGPGRPPKLTDAELVCLAVAQVLLGARSERHWLRFARERLGTCSRICPARPATTSACAPPATTSAWPSATWPWPRRRGGTGCGCWTPPPCRAGRPARRSSARRCGAMPPTAGTAATAAGTGLQAVSAVCSGRHADHLVPGHPHPRRT